MLWNDIQYSICPSFNFSTGSQGFFRQLPTFLMSIFRPFYYLKKTYIASSLRSWSVNTDMAIIDKGVVPPPHFLITHDRKPMDNLKGRRYLSCFSFPPSHGWGSRTNKRLIVWQANWLDVFIERYFSWHLNECNIMTAKVDIVFVDNEFSGRYSDSTVFLIIKVVGSCNYSELLSTFYTMGCCEYPAGRNNGSTTLPAPNWRTPIQLHLPWICMGRCLISVYDLWSDRGINEWTWDWKWGVIAGDICISWLRGTNQGLRCWLPSYQSSNKGEGWVGVLYNSIADYIK